MYRYLGITLHFGGIATVSNLVLIIISISALFEGRLPGTLANVFIIIDFLIVMLLVPWLTEVET